ncbi:hypothetical protein OKW49_007964 [Paraburkholderia youngii]
MALKKFRRPSRPSCRGGRHDVATQWSSSQRRGPSHACRRLIRKTGPERRDRRPVKKRRVQRCSKHRRRGADESRLEWLGKRKVMPPVTDYAQHGLSAGGQAVHRRLLSARAAWPAQRHPRERADTLRSANQYALDVCRRRQCDRAITTASAFALPSHVKRPRCWVTGDQSIPGIRSRCDCRLHERPTTASAGPSVQCSGFRGSGSLPLRACFTRVAGAGAFAPLSVTRRVPVSMRRPHRMRRRQNQFRRLPHR